MSRSAPKPVAGGRRSGLHEKKPWSFDRLSPLDASNLRVEKHGLPMNIAALAILQGTPLVDPAGQFALETARETIERRLHLTPRLRQVLFVPRLGLGPPLWIDDPRFDIREHVRVQAMRGRVRLHLHIEASRVEEPMIAPGHGNGNHRIGKPVADKSS